MRQTIRACTHCLWYEGGFPKAPLCPIMAMAPWISCMLTSQAMRSCWSQTNHLKSPMSIKHVLAYMTPDQTVKTVANFLYGGYISIFGAPARLLGDRGANFTSSVIEEMCKILGIKCMRTIPYHTQTNGLVERSHQMSMCMIGKLG